MGEIEWTNEWLEQLRHDMETQDNRATFAPVFVVQQKRRIYGLHPDYGGGVVWVDCEGNEADDAEWQQLEADWSVSGEEPEGYYRTGYVDTWEHVTTCFTERGAQAFIDTMRHRLCEPRIYVESAFMNIEWQQVVGLLKTAEVRRG